MIRKHHDAAKAKGVKIVHCCGIDSVPSDLGVWFLVDHIKNKLGKYEMGLLRTPAWPSSSIVGAAQLCIALARQCGSSCVQI